LTDGLHPKLAKPHPKELLIGHTITGVPERERPDIRTERRPGVQRQPAGAPAPEGTAGGVQETGGDRPGRAQTRGAPEAKTHRMNFLRHVRPLSNRKP
jgi:hypothetical protein